MLYSLLESCGLTKLVGVLRVLCGCCYMVAEEGYWKAQLSWTSKTGASFPRLWPQWTGWNTWNCRNILFLHDLSTWPAWLPHKWQSQESWTVYLVADSSQCVLINQGRNSKATCDLAQEQSSAFCVFYFLHRARPKSLRKGLPKGINCRGRGVGVVHWEKTF